jgi:serine/threonine protein kinase
VYAPKSLATELERKDRLAPRECLQLMLSLTETVEHLHQHKLIHRDIKPSNIIYVKERPKLADIDLVTDLAPGGVVSNIGTEGYLAPEGPGSAAADVFSLGRVLYVALTGREPSLCPELPTAFIHVSDQVLILELNRICCKACETELERRYSSAARMRADLLALSHGIGPE